VRDLMVTAVEQRFGQLNHLPAAIEWLSDNGSCYTATETRRFAQDIGFLAAYDAGGNLAGWRNDACQTACSIEAYCEFHPHSGLKFRPPREFIRLSA
jgi:putative transposase